MTLLYRSPNIVIDGHEWHVTVNQSSSKRIVTYRFRQIGANVKWQPITKWIGRRPKEMGLFFAPAALEADIKAQFGEIGRAHV